MRSALRVWKSSQTWTLSKCPCLWHPMTNMSQWAARKFYQQCLKYSSKYLAVILLCLGTKREQSFLDTSKQKIKQNKNKQTPHHFLHNCIQNSSHEMHMQEQHKKKFIHNLIYGQTTDTTTGIDCGKTVTNSNHALNKSDHLVIHVWRHAAHRLQPWISAGEWLNNPTFSFGTNLPSSL